tara:strand:+ start:332 stop:487 length:156 start_codon:yes stop_codon:yes gene_type:complete
MAQQSSQNRANVTSYRLPNERRDVVDTLPSDQQPPGVDEKEPESLEEALTG